MLNTDLLLLIFLILAGGKLLAIGTERLNLPPLIGELLIGIVIALIMPSLVAESINEISLMASIGLMLMMFIIGLSINLEVVMKANAKCAMSITLIGATLIFIVATALTLLIDTVLGQDLYFSIAQACIVGIALTSTSTVIGFKFLSDIGDHFSNVFKTIVAIEVTDGIFSITLLAIFMSINGIYAKIVAGGTDITRLLPAIGQATFTFFLLTIGFIALVLKFGGRLTNWLQSITRQSGEDQSIIITLSLIILFVVAWMSDWLQLTQVIGAFLAGAILAGSPFSETAIAPKIKAIGFGLFIPIFFAYTGMQMDFSSIIGGATISLPAIGVPIYLLLFLLLLPGVILCKYLGSLLGCAYAGGFKPFEARKIGSASICLGEDTLAIAQIGMGVTFAGGMPLISRPILTVLGLLIIITSILTPLLIKSIFSKSSSHALLHSRPPYRIGQHRTRGRGL